MAAPVDSEGLDTRIKVLANAYCMIKMRFPANAKLATIDANHFDRYLTWLKGPQVWGFVVKDRDGTPISCPHIGLVSGYDMAVRERQARLMNMGNDFQKALELSMADGDLRLQKFSGVSRSR